MKKIHYSEGDIFFVPLRTDGYGIGMIVRKDKCILLGNFWKLKFKDVTSSFNPLELKKSNVFWVKQFGCKGFKEGTWKIIGKHPMFNRSEWDVPKFIRHVAPFDKYIITYNDDLKEVDNVKVPNSFDESLPKDGLAGYGYIEMELTEYLKDINLK